MSQTVRRKRKKRICRRRRRKRLKVTCTDIVLYGPLAVFLLAALFGPPVYEFWYHRNVEYAFLLILVILMFVFVMWSGNRR